MRQNKIYMKKTIFKSIVVFSAIALLFTLNSCKKDNTGTGLTDEDKTSIADYVQANNLTGEYTSSGLFYQVIVPGTSNHPNYNSVITVSYKGYHLDGTVLDQGDLFTAPLSNLIRGWQEGIPYVGEGGKIKLIIPSYMAYNNGVLIFDVTLNYFTK